MIVAGLQFDIAWENPEENFNRVAPLARRAAEKGAEVIVLPEMFATGFSMRAEEMAVHAATILEFITDLARRHGVWVIAGYAEPGEKRPANSCSVIAPGGREVLHYRKIHPFSLAGEPDHFEAGEGLHTVEIGGVRVTPLICYDLRFPELFRASAMTTDLFVVIATVPTRGAPCSQPVRLTIRRGFWG